MRIPFPEPKTSHSLRRSLKRGLARQALQPARLSDADGDKVFAALSEMKPSRVAKERLVLRMRRLPGVVRAVIGAQGVVVTLRNACDLINRVEAMDVFSECALMYTRVSATAQRGSVEYGISRVTLCLHAMERLIERSLVPLDSFLTAVDAEAVGLLRAGSFCTGFDHDRTSYLPAAAVGVWAGRMDQTLVEGRWDLTVTPDYRIPTFSVRTFLSPDQMKPAVWLHWQPGGRLSAA